MKGLRGVQARTVFLVVILFACLVSLSSCGSEPNSWINLKPSGAQPSARFGQALVYVADSGKLVMFGGAIDEENPLNETWVYERDRNTWTDLKPSGELPPARRSMAAAYDPGANKIVVFGGMGAGGEILKDTWMYDVPKNTWTALAPSSPPSARYGAKMVYDPASGRLLLFGGTYLRTSATASFQQDFNDTWAFDLAAATWTGLSPSGTPPAPRDEGAESMIYNEAGGTMLLLAGLPPLPDVMTTGGVDKDWSSWIYDPCANTWADHPPALKSPPISQYYALALDSTLQEAVLFGGFDAQHATRDDTWIYDLAANTWSTVVAGVPDGPQARIDAAMVYNPETKTVIMFGGRSAEGKAADVPTDTWEYLPADSKG